MRIYDFNDARVSLWGAGREAAAAYRTLSAVANPGTVRVVGDAPATAAERASFGGGVPVEFLSGAEGIAALGRSDVVIRSPGVSRYRPEVAELQRAGVALTTGTNLWLAEHGEDPVLMVTGTKGKSTTSALIAHMAREEGREVLLAGNMGSPLLDHLAPAVPPELWVVELSSYQAADLERSPRAVVVLNLHPEHLDWHGSHERYFADKLNVLRDGERVLAVLNARDPQLRALAGPGETSDESGQRIPPGPAGTVRPTHTTWFGEPPGYDAVGESVTRGGRTVLAAADSPLAGEHNALNICAALTALEVMGLAVSDPAAALRGFEALAHRMQTVWSEGGLRFVDDSISTTPEATMAALAAFAGTPLALIAGGFDRGQDYGELAGEILRTGVRTVVALPDTGERLLALLRQAPTPPDSPVGAAPLLVQAPDVEAAVGAARESLGGEGVVLLSPAAPSYGAFRNFEERGERFVEAAKRLAVP